MKFNCNVEILKKACTKAFKATSTKVTIPTLEGILFRTISNENGECELEIVGYDLEFAIIERIKANIEEEGAVVMNGKLVCDVLQKLPEEDVTFNIPNNNNIKNIKITSGSAKYNLKGIDAEDFPQLPTIENKESISFSNKILKRLISQPLFAVAESDTSKPVMTGLRFVLSDGMLETIGVDGYHLAVSRVKVENEGSLDFIVPKKVIRTLDKYITDEEDTTYIELGKRHIMFRENGTTYISRLLSGDLPDYKAIQTDTHSTTSVVNVDSIINCIERCNPVIDNFMKVPICCTFSDNKIEINSLSAIGKVVDSISAEIEGEPLTIGFNLKYLLDAFTNANCDKVQIKMNGATLPTIICPTDNDDFLFIVMPMRIKTQ